MSARAELAPAGQVSLRAPGEGTLVWVLLDRSGSMEAIRDATIESYNRFVRHQARKPGARVSLTQFDDQGIDDLYTDRPAEQVPPLSRGTFQPRGVTPLYDAIGTTISRLRALRPVGRVVFAVITDGAATPSRQFSQKQVSEMVATARRDGWQLVFIGAGPDVSDQAAALGFEMRSAAIFRADSDGVAEAFAQLSSATADYRSGKTDGVLLLPSGASSTRRAEAATGPKQQPSTAPVPATFEEWEREQQLRLTASPSSPETGR